MRNMRKLVLALAVLGLVAVAGAASAAAGGGARVAMGAGPLVPNQSFNTALVQGPAPDGVWIQDAVNPAAAASARVHATVGIANGTRTVATLHVEGLPANRTFGAHLHRDACTGIGATPAGPHYQHGTPPPGQPVGTPSTTATPENEIWLDVTTNAAGRGRATTNVPFAEIVGIRSVVVHQHPTNNGGFAGQRMGCLSVDFG